MNHRLTAAALIAAAVLTNAGFTVLGDVFEYPDVLKQPASVVLRRFHEHQGAVSFWFAVLACSAALFAPIAVGMGKLRTDRWMRRAVPIGIAAAVVQAVGLLRWPILVPGFASDVVGSDPAAAARAADHFETAGRILGTIVGETCGYVLTAAWTALVVVSLGRRFAGPAYSGLGVVSAAAILLGVLSPLDLALVDTITFGGYVAWSIWLLWTAVVLLRGRDAAATVETITAGTVTDRAVRR